jgi:hypothetical protein
MHLWHYKVLTHTNAVAGADQMLAFNITASSLELANSVAIIPAESSVQTTGFPRSEGFLSFCVVGWGSRTLFPHTLLFFFSQSGLEAGLTREVRSHHEKTGQSFKAYNLCHEMPHVVLWHQNVSIRVVCRLCNGRSHYYTVSSTAARVLSRDCLLQILWRYVTQCIKSGRPSRCFVDCLLVFRCNWKYFKKLSVSMSYQIFRGNDTTNWST